MSKSKPSEYLPVAEEAPGAEARSMPKIDNAEALLADETVTLPPELIQGVLHQGLKAVIGGSSKAAKTWTLLDVAVAVATGGTWLGHPCRQGKVLYVNFEIPRAFVRKRLQAIRDKKRVVSVQDLDVWTLRGHAADLESLVEQIVAEARKGGYVLIIIDPIYKCYGGRDENKASDIALLCNEMERIAVQTGAALLYAAHYSKGNQAGKETLDRISGSGVFTRDADTIISFTKHAEENCYTVEMVLRNLPQPEPFVAEWRYPAMELRADLDPALLKEAKPRNRAVEVTADSVLTHVPWGKGECIIKEKIISICMARGIGEKKAQRHITVLLDEAKIFTWKLPRSGTRPAIAYARTAQSPQTEMTVETSS